MVQCLNHDAAIYEDTNIPNPQVLYWVVLHTLHHHGHSLQQNLQGDKYTGTQKVGGHLVKLKIKDVFQQQALYDRAVRARVQENPPGANPGPNIPSKNPGLA